MDELYIDNFDVLINPNDPIFIISVVSEMVKLPIWTLRKLDDLGVVKAKRLGKKTRCYSKAQIKTLNYICYLMNTKNVNISGIKLILQMQVKEEK
jgi:MerR family transcriptional regulator, heat shock protein HspR